MLKYNTKSKFLVHGRQTFLVNSTDVGPGGGQGEHLPLLIKVGGGRRGQALSLDFLLLIQLVTEIRGAGRSIIGRGGAHIHIFVFTDCENN